MKFLSYSQGSASEADTELLIAFRLGYITDADYEYLSKELNEIGRMISGLIRRLKRNS